MGGIVFFFNSGLKGRKTLKNIPFLKAPVYYGRNVAFIREKRYTCRDGILGPESRLAQYPAEFAITVLLSSKSCAVIS
jgi:hypothetical protein